MASEPNPEAEEVCRTFVRYMAKYGDQQLRFYRGYLQSPGCDGDYVACSAKIDLDRLADALSDLYGPIDVVGSRRQDRSG